jgi:hypothetical protein
MIKSRRIKLTWHAARMSETRKPKGNKPLEEAEIGGRMDLG